MSPYFREQLGLNDGPRVLEAAADEFDRRAMGPLIHPGYERARVMCCAEWLRDMAREMRETVI